MSLRHTKLYLVVYAPKVHLVLGEVRDGTLGEHESGGRSSFVRTSKIGE
jgi:hypothetical protein